MKKFVKILAFALLVMFCSYIGSFVGTMVALEINAEEIDYETPGWNEEFIEELQLQLQNEELHSEEITEEGEDTFEMPNLKDLSKKEALKNIKEVQEIIDEDANQFIDQLLIKYGVPAEPIVLSDEFLLIWLYSRLEQIEFALDLLGYDEQMKMDYIDAYEEEILRQGFEISILVLQSQGYLEEDIERVLMEETLEDEEFLQALSTDVLEISMEAQKYVVNKHLK